MRSVRESLLFASSNALDFQLMGSEERREGNLENALAYFSIAWGFNCFQEYKEGMYLCDQLMLSCGIEEDLIICHEYGIQTVNYAFNLINKVSKCLDRPEPYPEITTPPKGVFD